MSEDKWNWADQESVVIQSVQATAVYTNPKGDIVIRQESALGGDDQYVVIPRKMAEFIAKAIRAESKKEFVPE